jgi:hypothetical protein
MGLNCAPGDHSVLSGCSAASRRQQLLVAVISAVGFAVLSPPAQGTPQVGGVASGSWSTPGECWPSSVWTCPPRLSIDAFEPYLDPS